MAHHPTRREVLVQIAAGTAASSTLAPVPLQAQQAYQPQNLSAAHYQLLATLVDMVIPPSETPGAAAAGVDRLIDESLARSEDRRKALVAGLQMLEKAGFSGLDDTNRVKLLTEYSEDAGARGEFFRVLKDMTVEAYYSTEIGLVQELGYQGNSYVREFPGCQHEEHR
jgi:hypothetical protein